LAWQLLADGLTDINCHTLRDVLTSIFPQLAHSSVDTQFVAWLRRQTMRDLTFAFTGTLSTYTRSEATALVRDQEGRVTSSISRHTSFLVVGDRPGSKYDRALGQGVPCIDECIFLHMIGADAYPARHVPRIAVNLPEKSPSLLQQVIPDLGAAAGFALSEGKTGVATQ
jgi:hypothetical protein